MGHFAKKHQQGILGVAALFLLALLGFYSALVIRFLLQGFSTAIISSPPPPSTITFDIPGAQELLNTPPR